MTTVEARTPTTAVLVWTALLLLPAIALPLQVLPIAAFGRSAPWFTAVAPVVAVLAVLAMIWLWPDKGWRWAVLLGSLSALSVTALPYLEADGEVTATVAAVAAITVLVGVLGAAGWLAQSGLRALAAAVAGLAVVTSQIGHVVRAVNLGIPRWDLSALIVLTAAATLFAVILPAVGARYRVVTTRLSGRAVIAAATAALIPLAFAITSRARADDVDTFLTGVRVTGAVALVAAVVVLAVAVWAGPRLALGVLSLGSLVAGAGQLTAYVNHIVTGEHVTDFPRTPEPGLGTTAWLLILAGLAVGLVVALPSIRGYLGAGAALVAAVGLYLADNDDAVNSVWHQVAVATLVVAVLAGVAAVCDGPSAGLVGVMGVFLGSALVRVEGIWTLTFTEPVHTRGAVHWTPIALMGAAAVGLAVFTYLGLRAQRPDRQRLQTYQTSGLPTVP